MRTSSGTKAFEHNLAGRRFLIATAPFGPFARVLASELRREGAEVSRIILSGGDAFSWRLARGAIYIRDDASTWAQSFERMAGQYTDVVVFGESGPYNEAVLALAEKRRARTWVLENGYFRPDWVTIERNGVNWNSNLPRTRSGYDGSDPPPPKEAVGVILPYHVKNIALHHLMQLPGRFIFPHFRFSYPTSPWLQGFHHVRKFLALRFRRLFAPVWTSAHMSRPYFLACLQRDGDSQLLRHSDLKTNDAFMDYVVENFARFAPANTHLVIKNHPLDCGIINLGKASREAAVRHGVASRVAFIEDGNLAELCRGALGLIVNNSTAGLSALEFRTPVKVLGRAFFDFEGLTDQKSLAAFWEQPTRPDPELVERFRYGVIRRTQVNGSFHAPASVQSTARRIVSHLYREEARDELAEGCGPPDRIVQRQALR